MIVFAWLGNSNFAGEMALFADAVPLSRRELCGIQHWRSRSNVIAARPMTTLARNTVFEKRRGAVTVKRQPVRLNVAGMALQTSWYDGSRQIRIVEGFKPRGRFPGSRLTVVRDRCLEKKSAFIDQES